MDHKVKILPEQIIEASHNEGLIFPQILRKVSTKEKYLLKKIESNKLTSARVNNIIKHYCTGKVKASKVILTISSSKFKIKMLNLLLDILESDLSKRYPLPKKIPLNLKTTK
ncbi:MAG: hypothetical protein GWP19_00255 [Planctomycetia bacterium]|nr:hypothetical protein [Planctomycetia bacterium]